MSSSPPAERNLVLVFGATGAIGKPLLAALTAKHGALTCVAALRRTPLPAGPLRGAVLEAAGVDLRDAASVARVVREYAPRLRAVWNLAAPLSVETEADPAVADDVTVGGMQRLIAAMDEAQLPASTRLLFSDSIGSFGASAPKDNVDAAWLCAHPEQGACHFRGILTLPDSLLSTSRSLYTCALISSGRSWLCVRPAKAALPRAAGRVQV